MRLLRILFVGCLIVVIWHFVGKHPIGHPEAASRDSEGFISMIEPDGADPHKVLIFGPINCPKPAGMRCTALAEALAGAGVPCVRAEDIQLMPTPDFGVDKLNAVMNNDPPIVFINGRAKANPTLEEVIEEYNAMPRPTTTPNKVY